MPEPIGREENLSGPESTRPDLALQPPVLERTPQSESSELIPDPEAEDLPSSERFSLLAPFWEFKEGPQGPLYPLSSFCRYWDLPTLSPYSGLSVVQVTAHGLAAVSFPLGILDHRQALYLGTPVCLHTRPPGLV